jgi:hypothetical protein
MHPENCKPEGKQETTVLNTEDGVHGIAATTDVDLLDVLSTWPGRRSGTGLVGSVEIPRRVDPTV